MSILVSAVIVLVYIFLGGLTSAIYNEVLQFFLIVARLRSAGFPRAQGRRAAGRGAADAARSGGERRQGFAAARPGPILEPHWACGSSENPMGVEWFGMVMGLGFVLSFGYWCTDFLVVQRAMAANSMSAARRTPLIAAIPKMFIPVPGHPARHDRHRAHHPSGPADFLPIGNRRHARLQHDHPADARPLLPAGRAGPGSHRADGLVHVRHGGQRDRLQHRLDLRHLPELHHAGQVGQALSLDGPHGDGVRHPRQHRRGLPGGAIQQHHGLAAAGLRAL